MQICYSKPKIILIDDDPEILNSLRLCIKNEYKDNVRVITISNGSDGLAFIKKLENSVYNYASDIYLEMINKYISLEQAFLRIKNFFPTFIIDQNLDNKIKGNDIAKTIHKKILTQKVIMLTSEMSYKDANELHNNSLIDGFFRKDEDGLIKKLLDQLNHIIDSRKAFFNFDGEEDFVDQLDIIYDITYRQTLNKLLVKQDCDAYFILNNQGDIAVSFNKDDYIILKYKEGCFSE